MTEERKDKQKRKKELFRKTFFGQWPLQWISTTPTRKVAHPFSRQWLTWPTLFQILGSNSNNNSSSSKTTTLVNPLKKKIPTISLWLNSALGWNFLTHSSQLVYSFCPLFVIPWYLDFQQEENKIFGNTIVYSWT